MCTWEIDSSPWTLLHFFGVGLTAFSNYSRFFSGGQDILMEWIILLFFALPIIFIQLKLGGMLQSSMYGLFRASFPFFRGVAVMLVVFNLIIGMYYTILPVHHICAGFATVSRERELMQSCANPWNTPSCIEPRRPVPTRTTTTTNDSLNLYPDFSDTAPQYFETPVSEYMKRRFYQSMDITLNDLGGFAKGIPAFPLTLVLTWVFIFLIVGFGPRVFGWVVSILGIVSTLMMLGVLGNGWAQFPDASRGLLYYYLPTFSNMASAWNWQTAMYQVSSLSILFTGFLPTMGKFTGSGKITRNITWLIVIVQLGILRHLPVLTLTSYKYQRSVNLGQPFGNYMTRHIQVEDVIQDFVYSDSSPAASFFFFLAMYIHQVCSSAVPVVMILDNLMEMFHWLLSSRQHYKRTVWLISSAVLCTAMMLCGLPFTTRGGRGLLFFFDMSIMSFEVVLRYFVTIGLIVIYVWQKTAKAERISIGIWTLIVGTVWVIFLFRDLFQTDYLFRGESGIKYRNEAEENVWAQNSLILGAVPVVFVFIGMLIHAVQFCYQCSRSSDVTIEQLPPYDDAMSHKEKQQGEDVELVSSF